MAVYKRAYKNYEGPLTKQVWRFTILPRYSLRTAFESRLLTAFYTVCFVPHLLAFALIYARNNATLMALAGASAPELASWLNIDGNFFYYLFAAETFLSFFVVAFIGPGLISPDVVNNAIPLYLSRPFSRKEYVIGKIAVLFILTSLITWVPGLLLIAVQANFSGLSWLWNNLRLPFGIVVGSLFWILTISLISLAVSAWTRSRPIATVALFGVYFIAGAFGQAANGILRLNPQWGDLMSLPVAMRIVWNWLLLNQSAFGEVIRQGPRRIAIEGLPSWSGLVAMLIFCSVSLFLLTKKIRAVEVVR
jgi:ABC-2 type transport system permease protein